MPPKQRKTQQPSQSETISSQKQESTKQQRNLKQPVSNSSKTRKTQATPPAAPVVVVKQETTKSSSSKAGTQRLIVPSTPSSRSKSGSSLDSHMMTQMLSSLSEENFKNLQRLHLVIDLDSTFVSTRTDEASYHRAVKLLKTTPQGEETLSKRVYLFSISGTRMWTILRPGALEFMEFASFYFKRISVWSAGQKDYVDQIVSFLFPAHIPRPSIVFNWDDCAQEVTTYSSVEEEEESGEGEGSSPTGEEDLSQQQQRKAASPSNQEYISFTKPLVDIIPHAPKGESIEHMLILDDRRDIAEKNIENLVQIPPFEPAISLGALSTQDNALDKFVEWLMKPEVINAKDIRKIDKSKIFFTSHTERTRQFAPLVSTSTLSSKNNSQSQKQ